MHGCNGYEHHALVAVRKVVEVFGRFLSLLFERIRDNGGKVVILILLLLPLGNIALGAKEFPFDLFYSLLRRHGYDVDGEHHIALHLADLRDHAVLEE